MGEGGFEFFDVCFSIMQAERKANEWGEIEDVGEVIMSAEIAGTCHDAFGGESFGEEVGVDAIDIE